MRKLVLLAVLILACASVSFAQSDDYNKVEFSAGFSHNRIDTGVDDGDPDLDDVVDEREGFNGFNASITGNFTRYLGVKGEYSFHRKRFNDESGLTNISVDADLHTFVGGLQIKDNSKVKRFKPFAHLMAGVANSRFDINNAPVTLPDDIDDSETGFAGVFGGGLDIRAGRRVDIRAIQLDYNPTRFEGETQHNFRIGFGITIH
jgi:opacity protein-like surface antigen